MDLGDSDRVRSVVERVRPEGVFHLGAQSMPSRSWADPVATYRTNIFGTIHLYEALRAYPPSGGVVFASSCSAYGEQSGTPISEDAPLRPVNPYGVSKAAGDMISHQYSRDFGLRIVRARLFSTTGPGKQGDAPNDFARQLASAEREGRELPLRVGNLRAERDFSDVRDVVRALRLLLDRGEADQAVNVGSGHSRAIRTVLETLVRAARVPVRIETDPDLLRPADERSLVADVRRLRSLGFAPEIPLEVTLTDALEFWRHRIAEAPPAAERTVRPESRVGS